SICVRYCANGEIKERLFAIVQVRSSTGKDLYQLLNCCFLEHGLEFKNIVGESFDGASNMSGQFNGLQSFIKSQNKNSIYIWCYSHILNLCVIDVCKNIASKNLFGLLNRLATFFGSSYKRMNIWTRESNDCLFPTIISALQHITVDDSFDNITSSEASSLLKSLIEFKTILTAHIFLDIFCFIRPTSDYLQTKHLDFVSAWKMVERTKNDIKTISFHNVVKNAELFTTNMNDKLSNLNISDDIVIEETFPEHRIRRKKTYFDENNQDFTFSTCLDQYRVQTFQNIIDQLNMSLNERFSNNKELIADAQFLHPSCFQEDFIQSIPKHGLQKLAELASIDHKKLVEELIAFSKIFKGLVGNICERTTNIYFNENESNELYVEDVSDDETYINNIVLNGDENMVGRNSNNKPGVASCKNTNCSGCLVNCERQEKLESFMMMSVEKQLLEEVSFDDILEHVKQSSPLMKKMKFKIYIYFKLYNNIGH
ncbi:zinc finger MYM-type protein 1-like, partial [Aphis craccivora]